MHQRKSNDRNSEQDHERLWQPSSEVEAGHRRVEKPWPWSTIIASSAPYFETLVSARSHHPDSRPRKLWTLLRTPVRAGGKTSGTQGASAIERDCTWGQSDAR